MAPRYKNRPYIISSRDDFFVVKLKILITNIINLLIKGGFNHEKSSKQRDF